MKNAGKGIPINGANLSPTTYKVKHINYSEEINIVPWLTP